MKKKIVVAFVILSISLTTAGLYISRSIDEVIVKLESIITLHQVEILRKALLTDVRAVQQDLLLKDSPHATTVDAFVQHGEKLVTEIDRCIGCHYDQSHDATELEQLRTEFLVYQRALSRVYTIRANAQRLDREKKVAFHVGQHIIGEIDGMIRASSEDLSIQTATAMDSIASTKRLLTLLLIAGPALGLSIAVYFIKDFTGSVETLIQATRRIKAGDLGHEIEGLRDEFGELGGSFNEMAFALREMIQEIRESQKRYRMLFESAGDAIFILEAEGESAGKIVSANKAAADMHGYTVEELLQLKIQDLDTDQAAVESRERIRRILSGEWINDEITHRRKDGTVFPVEISAGLLELEDEKYILAFDKDITERKQAEEALQRTEQLAIVGEMAAGLAHEIKNPLAGIKVSIEVLLSELTLGPEDEAVFQRIIEEINRIRALLRSLLSYASPPKPNVAPFDVNRTIRAAVKSAEFSLKSPSPDLKSRKIEFVQHLNERLPKIAADSAQLQQVILNLLLNAIHAIPDSGTVSVQTDAGSNGFIEIMVSDTGKGIDGPDLERIFLPFFTTKPKGTGLGLSISKRLIEQQNGTIDVARNPTGGLAFTIKLPAEQGGEVQPS